MMEPIGLFSWVIIGAVAGWLAGIALKSGGGIAIDVLVGIAGAIIGGFLSSILGLVGTPGISFLSFLSAAMGAVALLGVIRYFNQQRRLAN